MVTWECVLTIIVWTVCHAYPMPRIDELIDQLGKAQYISTMICHVGIGKSQWEQLLRTSNTTKVGSVSGDALRTPWCTSNCSMVDGLSDQWTAFAAAYLDDLVINPHLTQLRAVLDHLHSAGVTAKFSKCQFGMSRCMYLGHVIGGGHVRSDSSKI